MLKKLVLPLIFTASAAYANVELPALGTSEDLWKQPAPEPEKSAYIIEPKDAAEFIDYLQPDQKAALVFFCAPNKPVCNDPKVEEALEMVAKNRRAQINVIRLDAHKFSAFTNYYRVDKVPHYLFFQGGIGLGRNYGVHTGPELRDWVDKMLDASQPQPKESPKHAP